MRPWFFPDRPFGLARRSRESGLTLCLFLLGSGADAAGATRNVGPGQPYATPCQAIAAALDGDTILIDAAGSYAGDVCGWTRNGLTLQGINGRPHIAANGQSASGKAIWVITGNDTTVDNIEFSDCHVTDANGAGIRQEGSNLTVRHAYFHDNDEGILAGDASNSNVLIEYSEFAHNGAGDGQSHNLYINHVATLVFRYNYSHGANVGHLLKSRALQNQILYNRLTGESGGSESYEINLPNGGLSYVIGNIVEQPATTQNSAMLDYADETSGMNPDRRLFVINNTFVNDRGSGTFLQVFGTSTPAIVTNNIFSGGGTLSSQATTVFDHNYSGDAPLFVDPVNYDYSPQPGSPAIDAGTDPGSGAGQALAPTQQYRHPTAMQSRPMIGALDIGAYEFAPTLIFCNGFDLSTICD